MKTIFKLRVFAVTLLVILKTMLPATCTPPSCQTVLEDLTPCIAYLTADDQSPSSSCCTGVRTLAPYSLAQGDRTAVCECLKSYAPSLGPINMSLVTQIPSICQVNVNLPDISPDIDCTKA